MTTDAREIMKTLVATGKFKHLTEIDEGANAFAFKARHSHLKREVFLKVYDYIADIAAEVLREPQLLVQATRSTAQCPYLVQVFDAEVLTVSGVQFLCLQMEYVHGRSLLTRIKEEPFGQQDAVRITSGILQGVAHLHTRRMLHRDLKPANVLLSDSTPKITDFGSVAQLADGKESVRASKHSALYVPPEGWSSPSTYTFSSDLYQVGIVLYELVNGLLETEQEHYLLPATHRLLKGRGFGSLEAYEQSKLVDDGIAALAAKGKILEHGRPQIAYCSPKLARIVRKATNPDPKRRYQSATEFLSSLTQVDVPNWLPVDEVSFVARSWRGWDWRLSETSSKSSAQFVVERSRCDAESWRRMPKSTFPLLKEAFEFIESIPK